MSFTQILLRRSELKKPPRQGERKVHVKQSKQWRHIDTKSLRLQLFEEAYALAAKTQRFIDMFIKFEIDIDKHTSACNEQLNCGVRTRIWVRCLGDVLVPVYSVVARVRFRCWPRQYGRAGNKILSVKHRAAFCISCVEWCRNWELRTVVHRRLNLALQSCDMTFLTCLLAASASENFRRAAEIHIFVNSFVQPFWLIRTLSRIRALDRIIESCFAFSRASTLLRYR